MFRPKRNPSYIAGVEDLSALGGTQYCTAQWDTSWNKLNIRIGFLPGSLRVVDHAELKGWSSPLGPGDSSRRLDGGSWSRPPRSPPGSGRPSSGTLTGKRFRLAQSATQQPRLSIFLPITHISFMVYVFEGLGYNLDFSIIFFGPKSLIVWVGDSG